MVTEGLPHVQSGRVVARKKDEDVLQIEPLWGSVKLASHAKLAALSRGAGQKGSQSGEAEAFHCDADTRR